MSDLSGDKSFQLRKKIEAEFHARFPDLWTPLYSMVTFTPDVPYAEALRIGEQQKEIMDPVMQMPNIEEIWNSQIVMDEIHRNASARFGERQ